MFEVLEGGRGRPVTQAEEQEIGAVLAETREYLDRQAGRLPESSPWRDAFKESALLMTDRGLGRVTVGRGVFADALRAVREARRHCRHDRTVPTFLYSSITTAESALELYFRRLGERR